MDTEVECPHCDCPMVCEYEMDQDETPPLNAYQPGRSYWYLAWLDLPDTCPEGCALSAEDKATLEKRTERELLEASDGY
jgi:hypothetical protein